MTGTDTLQQGVITLCNALSLIQAVYDVIHYKGKQHLRTLQQEPEQYILSGLWWSWCEATYNDADDVAVAAEVVAEVNRVGLAGVAAGCLLQQLRGTGVGYSTGT